MRETYEMHGREWRNYKRGLRMQPKEPRTRDWSLPVIAGCTLIFIVYAFVLKALGVG